MADSTLEQTKLANSKSNLNSKMYTKGNLFAEITKQMGLLPGSKGLNDFASLADESTQTGSGNSPIDEVRRGAEVIASDVISNFITGDNRKPPNKYCRTMRRTVKELSDRHNIVFKGMVNKLKVEEGNAFRTFVNIADEIFDDGQINWGRIVAVYAFALRLAAHFRDVQGHGDFPDKIALYVGKYVANKLGKWILDHGGWEAFAEYFPDQGEFEEKMWKGLLFTAVGLGALATVVATR
ncbi:anti-apoptotic protein NR13-like [Haliotis cracherodii]|uniref:anti-apoptotic protein NR13-like n=1 Tax=Haliotis cracherodii TaxID=6455 RepID=UPI0039E89E51